MEKCGCEINGAWNDTGQFIRRIFYCPLHKVAPEMLEALRAVKKDFVYSNKRWESEGIVDKAIANATEED